MKNIVSILSFILLLSACNSGVKLPSQAIAPTDVCPKPATVSLLSTEQESFYERFDYHIRNIEADTNTIKFQTLKQDFVFCRANNTWTVQTGTINSSLLPAKSYPEVVKDVTDPDYKTVTFNQNKYQYRVILTPNFFLGENGVLSIPEVPPEKNKIVFELISPNSKKTQRHTLYTLKDLQQQVKKLGYFNLGVQLGAPRITSTVIHGNRLWWSIAFEQGEGNTGIATIINYEPQTDKFTVIQPEEIKLQQITDLTITGDRNNPTLWMGTKISAEGTRYIPTNGLVAYRLNSQSRNSGSLTSYTVYNSPIVGAIPDKLRLEDDILWVGTGNGVCQVKWQAVDNPKSWSCWRFALMAKLPSEELPLYSSLTNKTSAAKLVSSSGDVEVLWWNPLNLQTRSGRYEVRYPQGFTVNLNEGATLEKSQRFLPPGKPPVYWSGFQWHWNGNHFERGFDEVVIDELSIGPSGIGSLRIEDPNTFPNINAIRGDLELLNLNEKSTRVKYYSGWVDEKLLNPYLTVVPQVRPRNPQPNPLQLLANQLQVRSPR